MATNSRKQVALSFLEMASSGKVQEAYDRYVSPRFKHHNPHFKGDVDSLRLAMEQNSAQFPNKKIQALRSLEDGDLVAVHSLVKLKPEDRGIIVIHIFRFEGGQIIEEWEAAMQIPETSPNENGML